MDELEKKLNKNRSNIGAKRFGEIMQVSSRELESWKTWKRHHTGYRL